MSACAIALPQAVLEADLDPMTQVIGAATVTQIASTLWLILQAALLGEMVLEIICVRRHLACAKVSPVVILFPVSVKLHLLRQSQVKFFSTLDVPRVQMLQPVERVQLLLVAPHLATLERQDAVLRTQFVQEQDANDSFKSF